MHSRRRRIEAPSSTGRESRTLLSSWVQKGQRILGGPTTSRAIRFYFSTCCVSMPNFERFRPGLEGGGGIPRLGAGCRGGFRVMAEGSDGQEQGDPCEQGRGAERGRQERWGEVSQQQTPDGKHRAQARRHVGPPRAVPPLEKWSSHRRDRKSTRLNSSHRTISYAVFC